ncbi:methionine--tRNA ligase [Nannocystis pusilla]|uniref:methionine--tRNA ligase n=1 Tax=Nannocystis pusilla TaxID=889268 RepID=UPI003B7B8001
MPRRVLVTAALPYANGSPHLGHLLEYIQTDVHVRARRLAGEDVIFMWAVDTHGTPIELRARREGVDPADLVARMHAEHAQVYRDFGIESDIFYTTHSDETRRHAEFIYEKMQAAGQIEKRVTRQLYCPKDQMFLPDRFVKGTCPYCASADQYGDVCEKCGHTYNPSELKDPHCAICGTTPELRDSEHLFVSLGRFEGFLREWLNSTKLQSAVRNYVMRWVDDGLRDWDISRDAPYFGFSIPGYEGKKFFYVWFDAPVGYIGATQKWCDEHPDRASFASYWRADQSQDTEIVHVIGKDIVYFHTLFWPAMLHAAGYTTPTRINVHGWLTVNGEKMSKTRGTFILARTYLDHLPADYLRYYFAAKLGPEQDDIDLDLADFVSRVNTDLVNKAANLASRCQKFLVGRLGGKLGPIPADAEPLMAKARESLAQVPALYANFESAKALRLAIEIGGEFDAYITAQEPWKVVGKDPERARAVCTAGMWASKVIAAILKPVLPKWAATIEEGLHLPAPLDFVNAIEPLPEGLVVGAYVTLAERIDVKKIEAIVEASKETIGEPAPAAPEVPAYTVEPLAPEASIEAFAAVDLRVGKVLTAARVKGSDKLLQLTIDLGPLGQRNIFSGIAASYAPEQLVGKHVVVFANLKPRKMRFGVSEGMVLASGAKDDAITVLELDPRSLPGEKIS